MKKVLLLLTLIASLACAQQATTKGQSAVITQLVDGDGWQTWMTLSNLDSTPAQFIVFFFKEDGSPLPLSTNEAITGNGSFTFGVLPANGSITIKTPGTSATLTQGWAKMQTVFNVPGAVSLREPPSPDPRSSCVRKVMSVRPKQSSLWTFRRRLAGPSRSIIPMATPPAWHS